jgi:hypothetical protein
MVVQEADLVVLLVGRWIAIVGEMVWLYAVVIVSVFEAHVFVRAGDVRVLFARREEYEASDGIV